MEVSLSPTQITPEKLNGGPALLHTQGMRLRPPCREAVEAQSPVCAKGGTMDFIAVL